MADIDPVKAALPEELELEAKLKEIPKKTFDKEGWNPKTGIGKKVKSGEIKDISQILDGGLKIMEPEIVDILVPNLEADLMFIGQAKGKFGGGQRRVFRQTQKKTAEGNKPNFATCIVIGNRDGFLGIGNGKSKETVPAREKALRNAKLNIMKIMRGCGSWQCSCKEPHSIPFIVEGKCGSVKIKLIPAPKGTGLKIQNDCKKILNFAGIKDIWSTSRGQTRTTINLIGAIEDALKKLVTTKVKSSAYESLGIADGAAKKESGAD
jgi:small subunit ribosomal protein S5